MYIDDADQEAHETMQDAVMNKLCYALVECLKFDLSKWERWHY